MANRRFIDFPIAASVGDNDIVLIWQDGLNKQTTKATLLQGSPSSLAGLTDVDISALTNGQILQYNSTTSKWENVDRTDINLSELGDVTIVAPANGQVLVYNSSTSKWENSSGGYVPYTGAVTTVNLGAQSILAGSFVKAGGTSAQFLKADGSVDSSAYGTGSVTSVALTMPTAFSVANSPVTTAGTLAVTATGTTAQYIRGDGSLATFPALTGFVPYTGATADVNLGTFDLLAERGTFENNGSSNTLTVNHTSGSGYGIIVTKGGNNDALYVSKTSGSGNAMTVVGGRTSLVDLSLSSVTNTAGDFLTLSGGVVHKRTAAQTLTDIGGQAALTNPVTGTGTTNYLPKFTGSTTIGNSQVFDDGTNVGINNASPIYILDAYSTGTGTARIRIQGTTNFAVTQAQNSSGILYMGIDSSTAGGFGFGNYSRLILSTSNYPLVFGVNSAESMRIWGATGNVNIGTTPASDSGFKLDVNGTGRFSGNTTGAIATFINTNTAGTGNGLLVDVNSQLGTDNYVMNLITNGISRMYVREDGNVGIGTDSPASKLDINIGNLSTAGAFNNAALNLYNPTNIGAYSQITFGYTIGATYASSYLGFVSTNQGSFGFGDLVFGTRSVNTDTQATERMRISSGGSVGINNTSPVNTDWGSETTTKQLSIDASAYAVINLQGSTRKYSMGVGDGNFYMCYDNTAARHNITVSSGGNVLIGTITSGSSKLRIVGLPTSAAGLSSGDVYNLSGVLMIA
jgi:hypothetical protein